MKRNTYSNYKSGGSWWKIVLMILAVVVAGFLGFLFAKPIMDIFR